MDDLIEFFKVGLTVIAMLLGVFGALIFVMCLIEAHQCRSYESVTGMPTKYDGLRCYVQDNQRWYSWEEYKPRLRLKHEQ
jgi:hypothetical protein